MRSLRQTICLARDERWLRFLLGGICILAGLAMIVRGDVEPLHWSALIFAFGFGVWLIFGMPLK
jgi:hypothetical protein